MDNITKELHKIYELCVEKNNQLGKTIEQNSSISATVLKRQQELDAKAKQLDNRELAISNAEAIAKMHKEAMEQNKKNGLETDGLNHLRQVVQKEADSVKKELADKQVLIDNANAELKQRERDLINGQKQLKIDRESMKQSILEELGKKL